MMEYMLDMMEYMLDVIPIDKFNRSINGCKIAAYAPP